MAAEKVKRKTTAGSRKKPAPREYYAAEIVANSAHIFGNTVMPECVEAALKMEGLEKTSIENAKKITTRFLEREVH